MKRRIQSGWCQTGSHGKCPHHIQHANSHRPDLYCSCPCHVPLDGHLAARLKERQ